MNRHFDTRQSRDLEHPGVALLCEDCFELVLCNTEYAIGGSIPRPCEGCGAVRDRKDLHATAISTEEAEMFQRAREAAREGL